MEAVNRGLKILFCEGSWEDYFYKVALLRLEIKKQLVSTNRNSIESSQDLSRTVKVNIGGASPVIMRKLGPPLLAGEPTPCGEHFAPVVLSFTHDALPNVDFTREQPVRLQPH